MSAEDDLVNGLVAGILTPLLGLAKEAAAPVLRYVPDVLEKQAEAALADFASDMVRKGLALLLRGGALTLTTSGQITLTPHAGPHPNDVT